MIIQSEQGNMAKTTEQLLAEHKILAEQFQQTAKEYRALRKKYINEKRVITEFNRKYRRVIDLFN